MPEFFKDPKALQPQGTQVFTFYELPGEPWLRVRTASLRNKGYTNDLLKNNRRVTSAQQLDRNRDEDRVLYPIHVITAWGMGDGPMLDKTGAVVPYTRENVTALLQQIPDHLIDNLRTYCTNDSNFVPALAQDPEETAKN